MPNELKAIGTRRTSKYIIIVVLITMLCLFACSVVGQLFFKGCIWWECAPNRSFDVLNLGLPSGLFPADAQYNSINYLHDDNPVTIVTGCQSIYWDNGHGLAIYIAERYATNANAQGEYERTVSSFFRNGNTDVPWEHIPTNNIAHADEYHFACGILVANDYRCGIAARYQEFIIFFNATINNKMTHDDFQKIIIFIDEQIARYLYGN